MNFLNKLILATLLDILIAATGIYIFVSIHNHNVYKKDNQAAHIQEIYQKLIIATGRAGDIPALEIDPSDTVNAYANEDGIVIYQGIIDDTINDDEIALILAHEIAHVTLRHTMDAGQKLDPTVIRESVADKMGGFYMMEAGFDICKGREFWLRTIKKEGDYINKDHPDMIYRYNQLNVGCGRV